MNTFVVLLWKDARVASNDVYGVVELDSIDVAQLVADKYQEVTGNKVAHSELRGMVSESDELFANLPRLDLGFDS